MSDDGKIIGIGFDMVKVARIESVLSRWGSRFEKRVFTELEITYCNSKKNRFQGLACRFAAKEAVFKALGTGWRGGELRVAVGIFADGRRSVRPRRPFLACRTQSIRAAPPDLPEAYLAPARLGVSSYPHDPGFPK